MEWECGLSLANTKGDNSSSSSSSSSLSQRGGSSSTSTITRGRKSANAGAPGESMLVHLFHTSTTVPLVGRSWQRGQHASFDVLDSGHTLLVNEEKEEMKGSGDENKELASSSTSEGMASSEGGMTSSSSSSTSVKVAHSTWPSGFAVSQMLDVPLPKVDDDYFVSSSENASSTSPVSTTTAAAARSGGASATEKGSTESGLESSGAKWDPKSMWCLATNSVDGLGQGDDNDDDSVVVEGTEMEVGILSATGLAKVRKNLIFFFALRTRSLSFRIYVICFIVFNVPSFLAECIQFKADTFGKSDPRCEVYWSSQLVHTTATMHKTLDPIWRLEKVKLRVSNDGQSAVIAEKELAAAGAPGSAAAAAATSETSGQKEGINDALLTVVEKGASDNSSSSSSDLQKKSVWEQGLVVEMYDMDMGRRGSFLGRVALATQEVRCCC